MSSGIMGTFTSLKNALTGEPTTHPQQDPGPHQTGDDKQNPPGGFGAPSELQSTSGPNDVNNVSNQDRAEDGPSKDTKSSSYQGSQGRPGAASFSDGHGEFGPGPVRTSDLPPIDDGSEGRTAALNAATPSANQSTDEAGQARQALPTGSTEPTGPTGLQRSSAGAGAIDPATGHKHHEATDAQPQEFGVMGGAHLNSADNKPPQTNGQNERDDAFGYDIMGPGPAQTRLPPTEPSSERASERGVPVDNPKATRLDTEPAVGPSPLADDVGSSDRLSTDQRFSEREPHSASRSSTGVGAETSTEGKGETGSETPALTSTASENHHHRDQNDPVPSGATVGASGTDDDTRSTQSSGIESGTGSQRTKVTLGEKVKGLVTEVKGHIKKDPEIVDEGKALRHGDHSGLPTGTT